MFNWLFPKKSLPPITVVHYLAEYSFFPPDKRNKHYEVVSRKPGVEVGHGLKMSEKVWRVLHVRPIEGVNDMFCAVVQEESCVSSVSGAASS